MEKNQYEFFIRIKFVEFCLFEDNFPLSTAIPSSLSSRVPTKLFRKKDPREKDCHRPSSRHPIRSDRSCPFRCRWLSKLWDRFGKQSGLLFLSLLQHSGIYEFSFADEWPTTPLELLLLLILPGCRFEVLGCFQVKTKPFIAR